MKRVYNCEQYIALSPNKDFEETSIFRHLHLLNADEVLERTNRIYYKTFEDFFKACSNGYVRNAKAYISLFNTPKILVNCGINRHTITKRNFKEICVWNHATDVSYLPLSILMKELPAYEFSEYLRERNYARED